MLFELIFSVQGSIIAAKAERRTMELESYFEFIGEDAIRIAGTRVGIETVLRDYQEGASPEEIVLRYPTLSLAQVHATITYYLANREKVETYLARVRRRQEEAWEQEQRHPSEFVRSLRERLDQQRSALHTGKPLSASTVTSG
jgi:uncharacterized protein (DUF433 family)